MMLTEEQVKIGRNITLGDELDAREIYSAYMKACETNELLLKEFSLGMIFKMGKIQGIRDERRRRRGGVAR